MDSIIRENQFEPITGLCNASDELRMKRMIFRVSRDKVLCTFFDAEFPEEFKPKEPMKIFVMFCPKIDYLVAKMLKVCDIYNCPRFDIPDNYVGRVMEILPNISENICFLNIENQKELEDKINFEKNKKNHKDANFDNYQLRHRNSVVNYSSSDSFKENDINEKFKKIAKKFRNEPIKSKKEPNSIKINNKIEQENNIDNEIIIKDDKEKKNLIDKEIEDEYIEKMEEEIR